MLVLVVCYLNAPWFIGPTIWNAVKAAPWLAYIFFVQNLFHLALPPAISPTWSLAIEEQYYFLWAPLVRFLRRPWMLASVLTCALIGSPLFRLAHFTWMTPTHTLIHLDGIALGSLLALGLYTIHSPAARGSSSAWAHWCSALPPQPPSPAAPLFLIPRWLQALQAQCWLPSLQPARATRSMPRLRRGPLAFYGRISYGLYMIHIMVFIYFGWFDLRMDRYGIPGNLAVVAFRLAASTAAATVLWYGFESRIFKLKRYF